MKKKHNKFQKRADLRESCEKIFKSLVATVNYLSAIGVENSDKPECKYIKKLRKSLHDVYALNAFI